MHYQYKNQAILNEIPLAFSLMGRFSIDGNILYACDNGSINLVATNGTRLGKPIPIHTVGKNNIAHFATIDSKGRILVGTRYSIKNEMKFS